LNIGSETSIRIIDLAKEVVSLSGKEIEIVLTPAETTVWGQAVDCSEARRLLDGWAPAVPLRDGLRRVYDNIAARLAAPEQRTLHEVGGRRRLPAP
jgi:nucleoside-diphosphate-sugar epimerase